MDDINDALDGRFETGVRHDDGTVTYFYFNLTAGFCVVERMTMVEVLNFACDMDAGDDSEAVVVQWANGYRDSHLWEMKLPGDTDEDRLLRAMMRRQARTVEARDPGLAAKVVSGEITANAAARQKGVMPLTPAYGGCDCDVTVGVNDM